MIALAFISFILLMIYSAWMTYNWVKAKGNFIEAEQRANATTVALQSEIKTARQKRNLMRQGLKQNKARSLLLESTFWKRLGVITWLMLLLGCTKQLIQPIENEPMVSVPERPDKMMGYFRQVDTGKEKLWCVSDNVHFYWIKK